MGCERRKKEESHDFGLSNLRMKVSKKKKKNAGVIHGIRGGFEKNRFRGKKTGILFGHVRFEMHWRHKVGDWKYNLKFRRKLQARDINMGV